MKTNLIAEIIVIGRTITSLADLNSLTDLIGLADFILLGKLVGPAGLIVLAVLAVLAVAGLIVACIDFVNHNAVSAARTGQHLGDRAIVHLG